MADGDKENPNTNSNQFNETNDDGEVFTLAELLDQQREIDEVKFIYEKKKNPNWIRSKIFI